MIYLALGSQLYFVVDFNLEVKLAGTNLRDSGLSDCISLWCSYLFKIRLTNANSKGDFIFPGIYNCAFMGDN